MPLKAGAKQIGQLKLVVKEMYEKQLLHKKLPNFLHPTHRFGNNKSRKNCFTVILYESYPHLVKCSIKLYHPTFHEYFSHGFTRTPGTNWAILENIFLYLLYFTLVWLPSASPTFYFVTINAIFTYISHKQFLLLP